MTDLTNDVRTGRRLHGDDMSATEIQAWYADEEYGYFDLVGEDEPGDYGYNALNQFHGFDALPDRRFEACVALGCAAGKDVYIIAPKVDRFYCIEPAEKWWRSAVSGVPAEYLKPSVDGKMPLPDKAADLGTCFGVLHHIPNVGDVLREFGRVIKPGGFLILREPSHSMGDWREPRRGLTRRERGISQPWLEATLRTAGFEIVRSRPVMFSLSPRVFSGRNVWADRSLVFVDWILATLFSWNRTYWRTSALHKLAPTSTVIVARRT